MAAPLMSSPPITTIHYHADNNISKYDNVQGRS